MTSQRGFTKEIIEEYNIRFQTWGNSDSWGLTEFKMLEDLIYESSRMRINANTLKRFFHQRTSNPQMATHNALCVFLGYSSYAEFVMKKTKQQESKRQESPEKPETTDVEKTTVEPEKSTKPVLKQRNRVWRRYARIWIYPTVILGLILLFTTTNLWTIIGEKYENHLFKNIVFEASNLKGASPFTVKIKYNIPNRLIDDVSVDCIEANGDLATRKLVKGQHDLFVTFIYPGTGTCNLKYKGKTVRSINVQSRTRGWSTYLNEDRNNFYQSVPFSKVSVANGYLTLPIDQIPPEAGNDKLFVSYTYYTDSIIDGDNFIAEARVRNSPDSDYGIPCYDIMMYAFSNTGLHGFALNENCYSYLKFISGETTILGSQHDLSRFNFTPSLWHTMRIEVINQKTTFYLDGEEVLKTEYRQSIGVINEFTLRFKGCGAVDYVKIMTPKREIVYSITF